MTLLHAYLLGVGSALTAVGGVGLAYTALALLTGWKTFSGVVSRSNVVQGAFLGLLVGLVLGFLSGHWWFPLAQP